MDLGRLSHHEWSGNSKADEMARSGATRLQVMSASTGRRGIRLQIWSTFCLRLLCTSARLVNGRPMPKVRMRWRFKMLFLWLVLGSRSRFTKLRGPLIAGDAPDASDMLATSQRWRHSKGRPAHHCVVLLEGLLHQFRECTRLTGFGVQDRSRVMRGRSCS